MLSHILLQIRRLEIGSYFSKPISTYRIYNVPILNDQSFQDFEDGIHFYTALEANCKAIITRNIRDFKKSSIPVFQPKEFLTNLNLDS